MTKESWAPSTKNTNRCKYTEAVERIFRCNLQYTRKDISLKISLNLSETPQCGGGRYKSHGNWRKFSTCRSDWLKWCCKNSTTRLYLKTLPGRNHTITTRCQNSNSVHLSFAPLTFSLGYPRARAIDFFDKLRVLVGIKKTQPCT